MDPNKYDNKLTLENITWSAKKFIIGSVTSEGISFAKNPVRHHLYNQACAEAQRLAIVNPGKNFIVFEIKGSVVVPKPAPQWSY